MYNSSKQASTHNSITHAQCTDSVLLMWWTLINEREKTHAVIYFVFLFCFCFLFVRFCLFFIQGKNCTSQNNLNQNWIIHNYIYIYAANNFLSLFYFYFIKKSFSIYLLTERLRSFLWVFLCLYVSRRCAECNFCECGCV